MVLWEVLYFSLPHGPSISQELSLPGRREEMTMSNSLPPSGCKVGVVIVSYHTCALLLDCLQSLQGCSLPLCVVVVDNGSSDGSVEQVRKQYPSVRVVALERNYGFAAANNVGLRLLLQERQIEYLLLLNPDTIVHPGALETLVTFLVQHPRVGVVGPRLLNPDGSIQDAAFRFPTLSMSLLEMFPPGEVLPGRWYRSWWHGRYPQERSGQEPFPIDHPLGACMLVRRSTLEQVGLLDERYFMYHEEIDWCWRIRKAGWAIWQVPQARVTHIGGGSTRMVRYRMFVELHRSRVMFFRTYYSTAFFLAHRIITIAGMLRLIGRAWMAWFRASRTARATDELRAQLQAYGWVMRLMVRWRDQDQQGNKVFDAPRIGTD